MLAKFALLTAILVAPLAATAGPITGTFAGTVTAGSFQSSPANVDGTPITGSFSVSTAGGYTPSGLPTGEYLLPESSIVLSYDVQAIGQTFTFPGPDPSEPSAIYLSQTGNTQTAELIAEFVQPHDTNVLELTGPTGSLFSNPDDLASFHIGARASIASPEDLAVYGNGSAAFDVTSDSFGKPVPEPATGLLLAVPLLAFLAIRQASSPFLKKRTKKLLLLSPASTN